MTEPASPVGTEAAALKRRKRKLLTRLRIPPDALPGSLVLSHRRCGKPGCHCAEGTDQLPAACARFRTNLPRRAQSILAQMEITVRHSLDPAEAYSMVPGRRPQIG